MSAALQPLVCLIAAAGLGSVEPRSTGDDGSPPIVLLAVGANRGLATERPLRFAPRDAKRYAATVAMVARAPLHHREVLADPSPSELFAALERLAAAAKQVSAAQVHFYFSGHGDRSSLHLGGERVALTDLIRRIESWPGQIRLAVIDACRSPSVTLKGFGRGPAFDVRVSRPQVAGTVILNAASDGEAAQESDDIQGAVFTQALLTGLRGAADVDGDRQVTLSELYRHAYRQTVLRSSMMPGDIMHPSAKIELEGAGEIVIGRPAPRTAGLVLPAEAGVRYLVFDRATSAVVAEVWSDPDRDFRLPLAPGDYLVTRRSGADSGALEVDLDEAQRRLSPDRFRSVSAERLALKGGRLRLFTHELRAGVAGSYRLGLGQHGFVGWGFGGLRWRGELSVRFGRSAYAGQDLDFTTLETEVELRGLHRIDSFDLIIAVLGRSIRASGRSRDEADREALGLGAERTSYGLGLGPKAAVRYRFELSARWSLAVEAGGTALFLNEDDALTVRPEATLDLGFSYEL